MVLLVTFLYPRHSSLQLALGFTGAACASQFDCAIDFLDPRVEVALRQEIPLAVPGDGPRFRPVNIYFCATTGTSSSGAHWHSGIRALSAWNACALQIARQHGLQPTEGHVRFSPTVIKIVRMLSPRQLWTRES